MSEHPLTVKLREALEAGGDPERAIVRIDKELRQPQLWGAAEVAECLGVSHTNMYKLGLPEPAIELQRGRLWSAYTIKDFARKRRRAAK